MSYQYLSMWIFVALVLLVAALFLFPSNFVILLSTIGIPVLLVLQVFVVLGAKDNSQPGKEDHWYDRHN